MIKETKICPNCEKEHNNPRSDYCNEEIKRICPECGKEYYTICSKKMKKFCSKECATNHKPNKCLNCGEPAKEKYCRKEITIICKICGKEHKTKCGPKIAEYCSGSCAMKDVEIKEKVKQTQIEKYGSYAFNTEEQRETMVEKYGHITPAKNEKVKKKIKETQFANNNGQFAFNNEKQKKTMMDKYGSLGRLGEPGELEKQQVIMMEKYGVATPSEHPEFLNKAMNTLLNKYGQIFNNSNVSKINKMFAERIENELKETVILEHFIEDENVFFDLYLPEHNIAIEINPSITHNSTKSFACVKNKCEIQPCLIHKPLDSNYHYKRAKIAQNNDLSLIQVYEWDNDEDIIKMIKNKTTKITRKYSARKLNVKMISQSEANKFLSRYHIQGATKNQLYCYGLFLEDEHLAVATFGKTRFKSKYEWEFIRYAVKDEFIIYGGAGKLFQEFIKNTNPSNVISYIDFNHTTKKHTFLNSIGFKEIENTGPRLVFHNCKSKKMVPMSSLLMIGADRILGTNYGPHKECGLNNEDIMLLEGYVKVYTAGNRVFLWESK